MTNLIPRDNFFQNVFDFRRDFDQIFNRMLGGASLGEDGTGSSVGPAPAIESYVDKVGKTFHCRVSVPGVDPKDVQVHAHGNMLVINGERKNDRTRKEVDFLHREIWYGQFERTLTLPEGVDADKLNAEYHNGMLEITAPIAASALPRRIAVHSSPLSKQMSA